MVGNPGVPFVYRTPSPMSVPVGPAPSGLLRPPLLDSRPIYFRVVGPGILNSNFRPRAPISGDIRTQATNDVIPLGAENQDSLSPENESSKSTSSEAPRPANLSSEPLNSELLNSETVNFETLGPGALNSRTPGSSFFSPGAQNPGTPPFAFRSGFFNPGTQSPLAFIPANYNQGPLQLGPTRFAGPAPNYPDGSLNPNAASQSTLGSIFRHTNAIPNSPLDISELIDVSELVPAPLGPVAASFVLSPIFSTLANGLSNLITNTAVGCKYKFN